jgi:menaquinone-specific isochorismate synthase
MTILPLDPVANATPEALHVFLGQCRAAAQRDSCTKLVSISLSVDALDPLAVLESIFELGEPHFYAERPGIETAIAGAEVAVRYTAHGPTRFADVQRWIDETLANTIAVGDVNAPFGGPHFFGAFAFHEETETSEPFSPATFFVPRWQVARAGAVTTAVANFSVAPDAELAPLVERVWRARGKFRRFEYGSSVGLSSTGVPPVALGSMGVPPMGSSGTGILPVGSSGMGVPPMGLTPSIPEHGRDARATQAHGRDARATSITIRQGAHLPHWTRDGSIYAVTFRLADSLPAHVVEAWKAERAAIEIRVSQPDRPLARPERERLLRLQSEKIEALLDAGKGACHLRRPEIAALMRRTLEHFDGERYELYEWCVMPNHVHAIVRPFAGHTLDQIIHSWKSFSVREANRLLERTGEFWQAEYYDHLIRDEADYVHAVDYVRRNPEKAGLKYWPWIGSGRGSMGVPPMGLGGTGILPVGLRSMGVPPMGLTSPIPEHGRDARATQTHGRDARATSDRARFETREAGDYRAAVARALERIDAGEFRKIVLARAKDIQAEQSLHPLEMLNGLRQRFPDCYSFSFTDGKGPSFIGASPERLVRVSKNILETEALAGSMRRGASASEDAALAGALLASDKDRREQQEVLDDIVARLTPLGLTLEFSPKPQLRRLANVQHLHTPVRAALPEGVRLLDVLGALHPTPAVGGSPRDAAVAHIRELEGFPRGLYAGALGWMNARGGGEFFVGLRSALVEGSRARLYAGAGIVAGSTPEKEFAETELKFQAILEALLTL